MTALAYRPETETPPRDGFAQLLHAEWTKLRSVRGWVVGLFLVGALLVGIGVLTASGSSASCGPVKCQNTVTVGPTGVGVTDAFFFAHQSLDGDGSITVRIASLTGEIMSGGAGPREAGTPDRGRPGLVPWSKAGIIVKDGTRPGSTYAAVLVTGGHGVRMQYDYVHDIAGPADARWLRLVRSGDRLTGYASMDGASWTRIGTARLRGLPAVAQAGLFAASPAHSDLVYRRLGGTSTTGGPTTATATFADIRREGRWGGETWQGETVGGGTDMYPALPGRLSQDGGQVVVTGSGDIAPSTPWTGGPGQALEASLTGATAGLIAALVVGGLFITTEFRRGLIRTSLLASPRRGRVLAAKAVVLGGAVFAIGFLACAVAVLVTRPIMVRNGNSLLPAPFLTAVQVYAGTAALLAFGAILALALGTVLRRGVAAVSAALAVIVLPFILATANVLSVDASAWVLRLSPAAGYAMQQSIPHYHQVETGAAAAAAGLFPVPAWGGLLVMSAYTALALALAAYRLRRRDA